MNIDWDAVAGEAEESPRGLLAEWSALAGDLDFIIVVAMTKDQNLRVSWTRSDYVVRVGALHMALESIHDEAVGIVPRDDDE